MSTTDLSELYVRGYALAHYPFVWQHIEHVPEHSHTLYNDERVDRWTVEPLKDLQKLHPTAQLLRTALWHGSESANLEFHSDLHEGHSFTLLIYGNSLTSGGELQVTDDEVVHTIRTGANIQAWVNQQHPWRHRVRPTLELRRVCSMEFSI